MAISFNNNDFGKRNPRTQFGEFAEALSSFYRKYFIQGQADYRAGNRADDSIRSNATALEAWHMGWNTDAEVERRGLQLSHLGLIKPKPMDIGYEPEPEDLPQVQGVRDSEDDGEVRDGKEDLPTV